MRHVLLSSCGWCGRPCLGSLGEETAGKKLSIVRTDCGPVGYRVAALEPSSGASLREDLVGHRTRRGSVFCLNLAVLCF